MSSIAEFNRALAELIPRLKDPSFPVHLAGFLKTLVASDNISIVVYHHQDLPLIAYNDLPAGQASTIDMFIKGAFLLDPYYLAGTQDKKSGFFSLLSLAPAGFEDSEYYRMYFRTCGLKEECGYLIHTDSGGLINISLGHTTDSFTAQQLALLEDITPTVDALATLYWSGQDNNTSTVNPREHVENALRHFGTSLLTEREKQVVDLVLRGFSTKAIGDKLAIASQTVKLHRKNAYAKLDVGSQGELFHLFIDSFISSDDYTGGDPLVNYLN